MRKYRYDIVVVGGGSAGVAAALGAAQAGAKTAIIERNGFFGGQATNSFVTSYCGFYTRGSKPIQVVKGIGQKVLDGLQAYGQDTKPTISPSTGNASIRFDPEILKLVLDELMANSEVDLFLHTSLIDVTLEEKRITELTCCDDEGHFNIVAKSVVDASGNANLINLAHIETLWGNENGKVQQSSLSFRLENLPKRLISTDDISQAIIAGKKQGIKNLETEKGMIIKKPNETFGYCTIPSLIIKNLTAQEMTFAEIKLRQQCQAYTTTFQRNLAGCENIKIMAIAPAFGIREARRIKGEKTLYGTKIIEAPKTSDSIARGGWSPEIHKNSTQLEFTHIADYEYFSIPLGTLKLKDYDNIWAAGRMISCDSLALGSVRVMGTGFATGHAAGVAAALTSGQKHYDIKKIQNELVRQGALI
ncbi:FAD-dependent oxidoreductase [Lactobacillus sp. ESL0791]|uniref:FAD-dependent oxidoreductase n=1 Tax=Lactobacillus sp. ESL0791 TaxID=2983234 RepID=UPI0023FA19D3|nr:FAD-dependent oxidoreductase [Lactobacillus sp. ESL0791]MDF7637970.1 FAD-dependent oxidoreductase [Lactobacillus sp. ESL0791]